MNRAEKKVSRNYFDKSAQVDLINSRKHYKRTCKKYERKSRSILINKLLAVEKGNPKEFWELMHKMRNWGTNQREKESPISPREWQSYVNALLNPEVETPSDITDQLEILEKEPFFSELDFTITKKDVEGACKRLNKNASPGPDKMYAKYILVGKDELMPIILLLFNAVFTHAYQPKQWTQNYLRTIFKKGEIWDPDNYRGIAIGSAMAKLFSLILLDRLEKRVSNSNPLSQNQIGFKKGHRTADHIFVIKTLVNKIVTHEKKRLFVAFIDFRKAYDRINRTLLFYKLQKLQIKGLFYKNIKALYKSVSYLVKVKGGHLPPIPSTIGLKQGGVLSPLLFNMFIDDIGHIFDETCDPIYEFRKPLSHLLYADDLALLSTSQNGLNNCLQKLKEFCEKWNLEINLKKSEVLIFNASGRKLTGLKFKVGDKELKIAQSYCYLGIDLLSSGSFRLTKKNLMEKAKKAMFPLFSSISQFDVPCVNALKIFHSLIRPIALYNAENWAYFTANQIETFKRNQSKLLVQITNSEPDKVLQKYVKFVLGVNSSCTNVATLGELGELPLLIHGFELLLNFWHRVSNMHEDTLARQALNIQIEMGSARSEWLNTVQYLLSTINLYAHYENPIWVKDKVFSLLCKKHLRELFIRLWRNHINGVDLAPNQTNKMRLYKLFKENFEKEKYLDFINDFQLRKRITKFRCSDHILEVEKGRHRKINYEDRICKICNLGVETEFHFLKVCPRYHDLRSKYLGQNLTDIDLIERLKCKDKHTTFSLINYLTKAFKVREKTLDLNM